MNKLYIKEKRCLLTDKKELDEILNRKYLNDEYLIESGRGEPRTSKPLAGEYSYGICMVIDDIAEHWLYRAINAEIEIQQSQGREQILCKAIGVVIDTFNKDIKQGYKTKDKEYVIEILSKALEA